jgi:DNA-binding response OmpR family regulator
MASLSHHRVRTTLVVEDDPVMGRVIADLLEDEGFHVMTAPDLRRARQVLASHRIGVLLLDLGLPDGDGETLLAELSASSGAPATVVMSAQPRRADKAAETYGLPRATKPLDLTLLATSVTVAFDNDIRPRDPSGAGRSRSTRRFRVA